MNAAIEKSPARSRFARGTKFAAALAFACIVFGSGAHAERDDPDYDRLRANLTRLENDPVLGALAPGEVSLAEQSLATLAQLGGKRKLHDHLAFLAERRVDIAYAAAQAVVQERRLVDLDREHDQILLAASQRDAAQARLELERQRLQSAAQAEEADRLRNEADAAREQSEQTTQEADTARKQAAQARKLADAQAREAELARKEADLLAASGAKPAGGGKASATKPAAPITLGDAAFALGQAALKPAAQAQISKIVAAAGNATVHVEAYAGDGGSAKANQLLAQQRAQAVRNALVAAGVPAARISAAGAGAKSGISRQVVVSFGAR